MKKIKAVLFFVLAIIVFVSVVLAATLQWEREVESCTDSDKGLNFTIKGNITGETLQGMNYTLTDFCKNNNTLGEYACSTSGNSTFAQLWNENCTCSNGVCV